MRILQPLLAKEAGHVRLGRVLCGWFAACSTVAGSTDSTNRLQGQRGLNSVAGPLEQAFLSDYLWIASPQITTWKLIIKFESLVFSLGLF